VVPAALDKPVVELGRKRREVDVKALHWSGISRRGAASSPNCLGMGNTLLICVF
jgi:hypothetical protein